MKSPPAPTCGAAATARSSPTATTARARSPTPCTAAACSARPRTPRGLESYGEAGPGRDITIYANSEHAFMVVDGKRFDTVALAETGTRWSDSMTSTAGFVARHPAGPLSLPGRPHGPAPLAPARAGHSRAAPPAGHRDSASLACSHLAARPERRRSAMLARAHTFTIDGPATPAMSRSRSTCAPGLPAFTIVGLARHRRARGARADPHGDPQLRL